MVNIRAGRQVSLTEAWGVSWRGEGRNGRTLPEHMGGCVTRGKPHIGLMPRVKCSGHLDYSDIVSSWTLQWR